MFVQSFMAGFVNYIDKGNVHNGLTSKIYDI